MDILAAGARLLLVVVFGVAAVAKLTDRPGSRKAVREFGVPAVLVGPVAGLLPLAELVVAAALLPGWSAWYGGIGALVLLIAFSAAIGLNLARGRRPDCRCFGQIAAGPIGTSTLVRNAVLGVLAALVVLKGPDQPDPALGTVLSALTVAESIALVMGAVALAVSGLSLWLLLGILEQQGRILVRLEHAELGPAAAGAAPAPGAPAGLDAPPATAAPTGLAVGAQAPTFRLPGLAGETSTLEALLAADLPTLLLFMDPHCGQCNLLLPEVAGWQRELASQLTVAIVSRGSVEENRQKVAGYGISPVLLQNDFEVGEAYVVAGTPSGVLVRVNGTIGSEVRAGPDPIRALVRELPGQASGAVPASVYQSVGVAAVGPGGHDHPSYHSHDHAPDHVQDHVHQHGHHAGSNGHAHHEHPPAAPPPLPLGPGIGDPAPEIRLPDLDGAIRSLDELRGSRALVLFWHPECGFCQEMLPELRAWEAARVDPAPRLFVVSGGSAESNRALGLRSLLVVDPRFGVGDAFGANGTPTAVLVDGAGRIASSVAVGARAVFALAGPPR